MIPYGRQDISSEDIEAVVEVLRSDFITQGPAIARFEEAVASYCGARHAVAVSNGTAALHVACLGLDVGPGDRIWTVPNTFVASANCGLYCGATVDFVDIDRETHNLFLPSLEEKLAEAAREGALPKVVVPVHFGGHSCEMAEIGELADRYGFRVLEDACHAIGGSYQDRPVGSCDHSDAVVFSFHPVKNITTGEGGIVVTNDDELAARMRRLRTHGITRDPADMEAAREDRWYYEQIEVGYNYRITDIQAALGQSQLRRLDGYVERRRELVRRYGELLGELPIGLPVERSWARSAWHLYVVTVDEESAPRRDEVFDRMYSAGVGVNVHYIPVHLQPVYRALGFGPGDFPEAERYGRQALTLPLFPGLTGADQDLVVDTLAAALRG